MSLLLYLQFAYTIRDLCILRYIMNATALVQPQRDSGSTDLDSIACSPEGHENVAKMELDELEQSVERLSAVVNRFPIGAVSLDDFKPVEEKIQATRESLMRLNARLLMLRAKYKQYVGQGQNGEEIGDARKSVVSDTLINAKAVKLCIHSTTILSIFSDREGNAEDKKKLYNYMTKLLTLNDSVMATQKAIEEASGVQLDLKVECQKALFDYKHFLKEQEQRQNKKLQERYPEIVQNMNRMDRTLRKINIMKKLVRKFIAVSGYMLGQKPVLLEMLENHRELINVETLVKMSQNEDGEKDAE